MHWARHKSTDHRDCVARHLIEAGTIDEDGLRHTAKLAWRALALLQIELEEDARYARIHEEVHGPDLSKVFSVTIPKNVADTLPPPTNDHIERRDIVAPELLNLGCPPDVAKVIAGGTSFYQGDGKVAAKGYVYVAGPMRGRRISASPPSTRPAIACWRRATT